MKILRLCFDFFIVFGCFGIVLKECLACPLGDPLRRALTLRTLDTLRLD